MADRRTLEQRLRDAGETVPERSPCANCSRACRPFEIVDVRDVAGIPHDEACSTCLVDAMRDEQHEQEKAAAKKLPEWDTPRGVELKAHRNRMLDAWRWTIMPDSPLSAACQAKFKRYLLAWQRMTVDAPVISAFKEPAVPDLEYAPLADLKRNLGL